MGKITERLGDTLLSSQHGKRIAKLVLGIIVILFLIDMGLGWYWSIEPPLFPVNKPAKAVTGQVTTDTFIKVAETLLNKPGGYLTNDMLPHRWFFDDMPSWEYGVLIQVRDMAHAMRQDMSRTQAQSLADPDLAIAEPQFNFNSESWAIPSSEGEYRKGIKALKRYVKRLALPHSNDNRARFYAHADNLNDWLGLVQNRLGALSQKLSDSVGRERLSMDLPGNTSNETAGNNKEVETPWLDIDNVFYRSRGACWALVELMRGIEIDFNGVLRRKKALISFRQVLRELEATQTPVSSPMVLNGSPFGWTANYSLVMANYISRANSSIIQLRQLLAQG